MKPHILITFLALINLFLGQVSAKESNITKLSSAYGFIIGQELSLELVEKQFPNLSTEVKAAWFAFNTSGIGEGAKSVKGDLEVALGDKWPEFKRKMSEQISLAMKDQQLTQKQAEEFLNQVKKRSKGQGLLPQPILATLLSANKRFENNPALEMAEGWKTTFSTKGHEKAKGMKFKVSYPSSWQAAEGSRPNIVQKFIGKSTSGMDMVTLTTKSLPPPFDKKLTPEETKEILSKDVVIEMLPSGSKILSHKITKIDGEPCAMAEFIFVTERVGIKIAQKGMVFVIPRPGNLLLIQCASGGDATKGMKDIDERYLKTKSLFTLIGASCVFVDKWEE